ncbi:MAG TPA: recombination protein NinG [Burkholderiaceae bacterium]|nr:recombination protein NinG [Burkholderiaceae bacterium]
MQTTIHPKSCRQCSREFMPARPLQAVCSPICAARKVRADKAQERVTTKARREAAKPRAKWLAECQAIVNKMVRLRDAGRGCISCDRPASWGGQWHASHLRSVGAASAVRFHLWNIHKGCSICNNHLSGNIAEYLPRVRARIGDEKVDWLYAQNDLVRHDVAYLARFKAVMGKRLKRMEKAA